MTTSPTPMPTATSSVSPSTPATEPSNFSITSHPSPAALIHNLYDQIKDGYSQCPPWVEFINPSVVSLPKPFTDGIPRLVKNSYYFRFNYLAIFLFLSFAVFPFSSLTLPFLFASWSCYRLSSKPSEKQEHNVILFGRSYYNRATFRILGALSVIVLFFTYGVLPSLIIYCLCSVFTFFHGFFRELPEDPSIDNKDSACSLLDSLSCLSQDATRMAANPPPPAPKLMLFSPSFQFLFDEM